MFGIATFQAKGYDLTNITYSKNRPSDPEGIAQDYFHNTKVPDEADRLTKSTPESKHRIYAEKGMYNYRSNQRRSVSQNMALLSVRPSLHTLRSSIVASTPPPKHPLPPLPPYQPGHLGVPVSAPSLRTLPQGPLQVHRLHPAYHRAVGQRQSMRMSHGSLARSVLSLPPPVMIKRPESSVYSRDVSGDGKEVGGGEARDRLSKLVQV